MPSCGCPSPALYLTGFHVEPGFRDVEVHYRCSSCGDDVKARYIEAESRLHER